MTASPLRRGWCPGALRPMPTGDGLLVRIRLRAGLLSPTLARKLAAAARRFGNGLIDLTSRANLQLRGVSEATHGGLLADLAQMGILDEDPAAEAIRNIVASPLAGLAQFGAIFDIAPIVAALDHRLSVEPLLQDLPPKFSFLVDDGGWPSLADLRADIRFEAHLREGGIGFRVAVDGTARSARPIGFCAPHEVADMAVRIALAAGKADRFGGPTHPQLTETVHSEPLDAARPRLPIGLFRGSRNQSLLAQSVLGIGMSFGRLSADALGFVAAAAEDLECASLRLTPWRVLLLPLGAPEKLAHWQARFEAAGFILDPDDARLAVAACPGAPACRNATTPTQADALRLADLARRISRDGIGVHVSGCAKGCACARSVPVTLVADSGLYGLVIDGKAQDACFGPRFPIEAAESVVQSFLAGRSP